MRIGILTGGGDAPGLNAVIRAVVKRARGLGHEVIGIKRGWSGLLDKVEKVTLTYEDVERIVDDAGTILLTSRTNPLKTPGGMEKVVENMKKLNLDCLIAVGGDDTLGVARKLAEMGGKVIGVPKTIDNDVPGTDFTFGFLTAVEEATEALDSIKITGASHERIMVVEIMGRNAGWIATYAGIASGADLILVPERPFKVSEVIDFVKEKRAKGKSSLLIVVAEGAMIRDYAGPITKDVKTDQFGNVMLGGIGEFLAKEIEKKTGYETRAVAPGDIIRGRKPIAFDRVLATRFGLMAAELSHKGKFGTMVALRGTKIVDVDLIQGLTGTRILDEQSIEFMEQTF